MDFHPVEANLRQSFRLLALARARADVAELPGMTIASSDVTFRMFNAAFLSAPVRTPEELEYRLDRARRHFESRGLPWSFWCCEDWLERRVRPRLSPLCAARNLRLASELPGMQARELYKQRRALPQPEVRRVENFSTLQDFRTICSLCFHVPPAWFSEVFHDNIVTSAPDFVCWVGYDQGRPIATAATVTSGEAIGIYNIGVATGYRGRGVAEGITRHAVEAAQAGVRDLPLILQSTSLGQRMYQKMGFREVTRILVYNSVS